jgi:hypothetical protein
MCLSWSERGGKDKHVFRSLNWTPVVLLFACLWCDGRT